LFNLVEKVHHLRGANGAGIDPEVKAPPSDAGDEVFIPAPALHTVRNVGGTTARWLYGYRER